MQPTDLRHVHVERYTRRRFWDWDKFETRLLRVVLALLGAIVVYQIWLVS